MAKMSTRILVTLTDKASKPARDIAKSLRELQKLGGKTSGKLDFKVVPGAARSINAMAKSAAKLNREASAAARALASIRVPRLDSPFGGMRRDIAGLLKDLKRLRGASQGVRMPRGYGYGRGSAGTEGYPSRYRRPRRFSGENEAASYIGVHGAHRAGIEAGRTAKLAGRIGADAAREEARDYLAGLSDADSGRLKKRAVDLSSQYPSVDANTLHERLRDTALSMGSVDKAMEVADTIGRSTTVLQSLKGKEQAVEQGRRFFSALDNLGKNVDPAAVKRLADGYTKALGVEGADLDLGGLLQMARKSKSGGASLNEKFLTTTAPSLMMDMRPNELGTALGTEVSQVIGGRATKASKAYQQQIGMRDKHGRFPKKDADLILSDPYEYTQKRLMPILQKQGVDVNNDRAVVAAMSKVFSAQTVANLFTKMITQREQYDRKREQYDAAPGLAAADKLRAKDPYVALGGARSQAENLLGGATAPFVPAATEAINQVTDKLSGAAKSLNENPDLAKIVVPSAGAIAATLGARFGGAGLLAAAGNSNGLLSGMARLGGRALIGSSAVGSTALPLAAGAAAGVAADSSETVNESALSNAISGTDTPFQRTAKALSAINARIDQQATAAEMLKGQGFNFSDIRAGNVGDSRAPVATPWEQSGGFWSDFFNGRQKGSFNLPAFGPGERAPQTVPVPPQRPAGLPSTGSPQGSEAPASVAPKIDTSQIEGAKPKADEARTAIESLNLTVTPNVNAGSIAAAQQQANALLATLNRIGPAAAGAAAQVASASAQASSTAARTLAMSKQNSTSTSPV